MILISYVGDNFIVEKKKEVIVSIHAVTFRILNHRSGHTYSSSFGVAAYIE